MFYVGQKVICVDGCGELKTGETYTIIMTSDGYVYVDKLPISLSGGWDPTRFEHYSVREKTGFGKFIKRIENASKV